MPFSTIEIYNSLGTKVDLPIFINKKEIDISSLSSGIYYLKNTAKKSQQQCSKKSD